MTIDLDKPREISYMLRWRAPLRVADIKSRQGSPISTSSYGARAVPEQSDVSAAEGRELPPILRSESLGMSGVSRLREAATYFGYTAQDVGTVKDEWRHHIDVTPVHEAGHAVANSLEGRRVRDVRVWWFSIGKKNLGEVRLEDHTGGRTDEDEIDFLSIDGALKSIVGTYAGPVAELRYDPRRVHSGASGDINYACIIAYALERRRVHSMGIALDWCWREACRMFLDDRVWAATIEIADRLRMSRSHPARVSGGAVHTIVRKHLPDGWTWSDPPSRMRRRRAAA